jgi:hypothetical protein
MSRRDDTYVSPSTQAKMANEFKADLAISPHHNAATPSARGLEVLFWGKGSATYSIQGKRAALLVYRQIEPLTPWPDRGLKMRSDLAFLNQTRMPAILPEYGFLTNTAEEVLIHSAAYHVQAAENSVRGICGYFAIPYVPASAPAPAPDPPTVYYWFIAHANYDKCRVLNQTAEDLGVAYRNRRCPQEVYTEIDAYADRLLD